MSWRDRITVDADVLVGKPIVKGTRISVEFVVDLLGRGHDVLSVKESMRGEKDWAGHFSVVSDDRICMRPLPGVSPPEST